MDNAITVKRIRIKDSKGIVYDLEEAFLEAGVGIAGDVHKGRDLTLLDDETSGALPLLTGLCTPRFMENITLYGDTAKCTEGMSFKMGTSKIRITQKGKRCFAECGLAKSGRSCGLSKNILFAEIIESGIIKIGNLIEL